MSKFRKNKHLQGENGISELSFIDIIKSCLLFLVFFCALSLVLILITSFIFFRLEDPTAWLDIIGKFVLYFSALVSGFLLSKRNLQRYVPGGLFLGALITALIFTLSLILQNETANNNALWLALIPVCTVLGSVLGIKRTSKPRRHKRH